MHREKKDVQKKEKTRIPVAGRSRVALAHLLQVSQGLYHTLRPSRGPMEGTGMSVGLAMYVVLCRAKLWVKAYVKIEGSYDMRLGFPFLINFAHLSLVFE